MNDNPQTDNLSATEKRALLTKLLEKKANQASQFPLSFAQERLWFLSQLDEDSTVYNISRALQIRGNLSVGALHQALQAVVDRHESLRTTFQNTDEGPRQVIAPTVSLRLPVKKFAR